MFTLCPVEVQGIAVNVSVRMFRCPLAYLENYSSKVQQSVALTGRNNTAGPPCSVTMEL